MSVPLWISPRRGLVLLAMVATFAVAPCPARSDDDIEWVDESRAPAPDVSGRSADAGNEPRAGADHDATVGAWGFQVAAAPRFAAAFGADAAGAQMVGVRRWMKRHSGFEAGAVFQFTQVGAEPEPTLTVFGGTFGYLRAMGVYRHMTVFWEPQGTVLLVTPNDGVDGTDDPTMLLLQARFSIGTEVRLGFIDLPEIGLTARIAAGIEVANNGDESDLFIGTEGGFATSARGLLETGIGFVFYIP